MLVVIAVLLFLILFVLAPDFVSEGLAFLFKLAFWIVLAGIVVAICVAVGVSVFEGAEAVVTYEYNTPAPHQPAIDTEDLRSLGYLFAYAIIASSAVGMWNLAGDAYLWIKGGKNEQGK